MLNIPRLLLSLLDKKENSKKDQDVENEKQDVENKEQEENKEDLEYECIDFALNNISDLIQIGKKYPTDYKDKKKFYNYDIKILHDLIEPLSELKNLIGLDDIKNQIFNQIIFYIQHLDNKNNDYLHTVIQGTPGVGKTELAKIIGKIYCKLGILKKGHFKSVKRSELVGGYLGQTAIKTQKILDAAKGGVLFIDEAYSLGNKEGKDSYSKECIDTLTSHLSESKNDFVCIIAGYKEQLNKCFFSYNEGLQRRFPYRYEIKDYSHIELKEILKKKIKDYDWKIKSDEDLPDNVFEEKRAYFKYNGGDIENLFHKIKIAHSKRVVYLKPDEKKIITKNDLINGFNLFINDDEIKQRDDKYEVYQSMYC